MTLQNVFYVVAIIAFVFLAIACLVYILGRRHL